MKFSVNVLLTGSKISHKVKTQLCKSDKLAEGVLGGISGKVISLKLGDEGARAYAIDLGVQYDLPSTSLPFPIRVGAASELGHPDTL